MIDVHGDAGKKKVDKVTVKPLDKLKDVNSVRNAANVAAFASGDSISAKVCVFSNMHVCAGEFAFTRYFEACTSAKVDVRMYVCVRACVRACAYVGVCVCACVCACACVSMHVCI